jgi:hypothetical protein
VRVLYSFLRHISLWCTSLTALVCFSSSYLSFMYMAFCCFQTRRYVCRRRVPLVYLIASVTVTTFWISSVFRHSTLSVCVCPKPRLLGKLLDKWRLIVKYVIFSFSFDPVEKLFCSENSPTNSNNKTIKWSWFILWVNSLNSLPIKHSFGLVPTSQYIATYGPCDQLFVCRQQLLLP